MTATLKEWHEMNEDERNEWIAVNVFGEHRALAAGYMNDHETFQIVLDKLVKFALLRVWAAELLKIRTYGASVSSTGEEHSVHIDMHALGHFARWTVEDAGLALWNMREQLVSR